MKYKVGDKIKIKKDGICFASGEISSPNGIVTIQEVRDYYYIFKEFGEIWHWFDRDIKGLELEPEKLLYLTTTRFELMDFD